MFEERILSGGDDPLELARLDLVNLCQHPLVGHGRLVHALHDIEVGRGEAAPRVDQQEGAQEPRSAAQIIAYKPGPGFDARLRRFGEAVAGEVDEKQRCAGRLVEIQVLRAAGGVGCPRQRAPDEPVDEARLADVGAAHNTDLGALGRWKARQVRHALEELPGTAKQRLPGRQLLRCKAWAGHATCRLLDGGPVADRLIGLPCRLECAEPRRFWRRSRDRSHSSPAAWWASPSPARVRFPPLSHRRQAPACAGPARGSWVLPTPGSTRAVWTGPREGSAPKPWAGCCWRHRWRGPASARQTSLPRPGVPSTYRCPNSSKDGSPRRSCA